jgi:cyclic beta-1,2-glucan synthetase
MTETGTEGLPELRPLDVEGRSPAGRLLTNGRWTTLVTAAGTGFATFDGAALTRWRADRVTDPDGAFIYLRDLETGESWSLGHQPCRRAADRYEVSARPGVVAITRRDAGLEATLEVCVAPDAPVELRRVILRDLTGRARRVELTSCAEVVLQSAAADASHPAFSKLFVQTERTADPDALLARRRPRARGDRHPWLAHALAGDVAEQVETDRMRFVGRGRSPASPAALAPAAALTGTTGAVLDPVLALRRVVRVEARGSATLTFLFAAGDDRDAVLAQVRGFGEPLAVETAFARAGDRAHAELARCGLSEAEAAHAHDLAVGMLYGDPALRAPADVLARADGPAAAPAGLELAPGRPWVVVDARGAGGVAALDRLERCARLWGAAGLPVEVIALRELIDGAGVNGSGAEVHALDPARLGPGELDRLLAGAALVIGASGLPDDRPAAHGRARPVPRPAIARPAMPARPVNGVARTAADWLADGPPVPVTREPLQFANGCGGFSEDGREYVIRLAPGPDGTLVRPPLPWINVIANERFGFVVSETGAGGTWSGNSREHRLTPWSNDPVLDPHDEALYLRDADSGRFWSPLPGPVPAPGTYEARHGFGVTTFTFTGEGLEHETTLFVPRHDPVKIVRLRLTNPGSTSRRLSLFSYQRLVLGGSAEECGREVVTEYSVEADALLARRRADPDHGGSIAFATVIAPGGIRGRHVTGDREMFLGRHRGTGDPHAVACAATLDDRTGAGLDPCFAQQVTVEVPPGACLECAFLLGAANSPAAVRELVARYRSGGMIQTALEEVTAFWTDLIGTVRVETPVPALDLVLNGWLLYQTLVCRIWARTAFYQSGGAFGFRDQLQDAAAFMALRPAITREQILLHAAHQFVEGDVMHWWHPPRPRGLRTRFADDLLWLPYVTAAYLGVTGDRGVLEEEVPFVFARALEPGEDEAYLVPDRAAHTASVYQHCVRAIDRSLATGTHGLPLFGSGDWNDGMNRVGRLGQGESTWMAMFLVDVLESWGALCEGQGDVPRANRYRAHREHLRTALEASGWDGAWYRRGYFDDGAPLGSAESDECRIDALAQAWAVISGAAPRERAERAMDAVEQHLISERDGIVRLLTPPFDCSPHDPGYIQGYVPGVRENGGQYTHAALWVVRALAELGRGERAARVLEMLSPVTHTADPEQVARYRVEPYVVAADVYGEPPHVGRGGWTWYTGSAGWMQRVALESVLGVTVEEGTRLVVAPRIPPEWTSFRVTIRPLGGGTPWRIDVRNPGGTAGPPVSATVDGRGVQIVDSRVVVPLVDDGALHRVEITLG